MPRPILVFLLLLTVTFTVAACLEPRVRDWKNHAESSKSVLQLLFGDSRRLFAGAFYNQADVTFHSGYYPSFFDQARMEEENDNDVAHGDQEPKIAVALKQGTYGAKRHLEPGGFMGPPTDWIDRFGRHFLVSEHTHLQGQSVQEILPWLRISAELDPHRIVTYTTAAYWLRDVLGKVNDAEAFLREGLRANPDSYEILFELGRLYDENRHDETRARNVWLLALRRWKETELKKKDPFYKPYDKIVVHLAHLEQEQGNYAEAIKWFELAKPHSPAADAIQKQIDELREKMASEARTK